MNIIIPRTWSDEQFRQDVMNAINLLMMQKKIHPDTHYAFYCAKGRNYIEWKEGMNYGSPRVVMWQTDKNGKLVPGSTVNADPLDLITANTLAVVRGKSDYV